MGQIGHEPTQVDAVEGDGAAPRVRLRVEVAATAQLLEERVELTDQSQILGEEGLAEAARGASIDDIQSIAVYSTTGRSRTTSADISAFLSGYLSNIKNYTAHNLDLYYVQSFVDARRKAAELGAGGLLAVHAESFTEYKNTAAAQRRLFDTKSGSAIQSSTK